MPEELRTDLRVLVAGEDADQVNRIASCVKHYEPRWKVETADSLSNVLERTTRLIPDLLILISDQPAEALTEVVNAARTVPACDQLPVLQVVSGHAGTAALEAAERAGIEEVVSLSDDELVLRHKVLLLLRLKQYHDSMRAARARVRGLLAEHRAMLQRSEERFEALTGHSREGIVVAQADGTIRFMSAAMERLLGWPRAEVRGRSLWDAVHPDDLPRLQEAWRNLLESPMNALATEVRVRDADGQWRWLGVVATNQLQLPNVLGIVLNCTDIQDQQKIAAALKASQKRYKRLLQTIQEGVWITDERDRTVYVSERMAAMLGYRPDEMIGEPAERFMLAEDVPAYRQRMEGRVAGVVETYEHRFVRSDGSVIWARVAAMPLYDEDGTYQGSFGMVQDITEQRKSEQALRDALARFRALIENALMVAIQGMEADGTVTLWNRACAALYGYTAEEALGRRLQDFLLPLEEVERFLETLREIWASGEPTPVQEWTVRTRSGEERYVLSTMVPTQEQGKVTCVYCMDVDITERVRVERELEATNRRLEQLVEERTARLREAVADLESFAYSVSHDLKTPLRIIQGYASSLREECEKELPQKVKHNLATIVEYAEVMSGLIDSLLAFSRYGRQYLSIRRLRMRDIVERALAQQDPQLRERAVVTVGDLPDAYGDMRLIIQVMVNLLSNALKYSRTREEPRVEVFFAGEKDGLNAYAVRDNGVGFDPRYSDRLFQVFRKLHNRSDFEGFGIGLAIVRRIIKRHGGEVWAEGAEDQGATFYFSLPSQEPPAPDPDQDISDVIMGL